jgi:hypothetical protein
MKNIFIILVASILTFTNVYAASPQMQDKILQHVNPLPNLVRHVMAHKESLNISQKQLKDIKTWASFHKPQMKKMIKEVIQEEKKLLQEALTTDKDVVKHAEKMLDTRRNIIKMKTDCRAFLRSVLTKQQYKRVLQYYIDSMKK